MQVSIKKIALNYYSPVNMEDNLNKKAEELFENQKNIWPLLSDNLAGLNNVNIKEFGFGHFSVKVQYNPHRRKSSAAKVDPQSIKERQCFLCAPYLPGEQKGVLLENNYLLLVNPYPIFPEHFTIPTLEHIPQSIGDRFFDLLDISRMMSGYTVFYNGPRCGASAPDHHHFQAGNRGFMPIENEFNVLKNRFSDLIFVDDEVEVFGVKNYLRKFISIESEYPEKIDSVFRDVYKLLDGAGQEPMLNILANYTDGKWRIIIFPRQEHRPRQYYSEGEDRILISPASVDFGGVCITPGKNDFDKLDSGSLTSIFEQVSISDDSYKSLVNQLKNILS